MKPLPLISAGPPFPADLQYDEFDIERYLLQRPSNSFYIQVSGDSMIERGIADGDILVIDKSLPPRKGSIVVAQVDGGFTIKSYDPSNGRLHLVPANGAYLPVEPPEDSLLCGVATFLIKRL